MEVFPPHVFQDWSFAWDSTLKILKWLAKAPMTRYCESGLARSSCLCTHCRPKSQAHVKLKVFFQGCKVNWTAPSSLGVIDWTPHSAQQDRQAPTGSCVTEMTCPGLIWAKKAMFHFQLYVMRVQGRPMASLCGKCLLWNWHQILTPRFDTSTLLSGPEIQNFDFWILLQDSSFMVQSIQMSSWLRKLCFSIHFNSIYWPEQYFRENSSRLGMDPWCFRFLRQDVVFVYSFAKERCPRLVAVQDRTWWFTQVHGFGAQLRAAVMVRGKWLVGEKKARVMQGLRIKVFEWKTE